MTLREDLIYEYHIYLIQLHIRFKRHQNSSPSNNQFERNNPINISILFICLRTVRGWRNRPGD